MNGYERDGNAAFTKTPEWMLAILGRNPNIILELTVDQRWP